MAKPLKFLKYVKFRSPIKYDRREYKKNTVFTERNELLKQFASQTISLKELTSYDAEKFNRAKILFGFSSRFNENYSNCLNEVVEKAYKNCANPDNIAFSIVIDDDDTFAYFHDFLKKHPGKNIRFFISPRHKIEGLHKYDKYIFNNLPDDCTIFFDFSDDALITMKNYDEYLLNIEKKFPDGIFMVHTRDDDFYRELELDKNPMLIPWLHRGVCPTSVFPIISRKIIDIAAATVAEMNAGSAWSPLSNSWIFDCYVDYLSHVLKARGYGDRVITTDMVERITTNDKLNSHNQLVDERGLNRADRALMILYKQENLDVLNRTADNMVKHINGK